MTNCQKTPEVPVSVVMPVRNAERYIIKAVRSILLQTGIDFEVIVIDDGSTDQTPALLASLASCHTRLHVHQRVGPGGISQSLNQGIALARGRYIARMDADDIALKGRLAAQYNYLETHPNVGVIGTQARFIDKNDIIGRRVRVPVGVRHVCKSLKLSSPLIHPTVMMRRDLVLSVGGYRSIFDSAEDYDLWLRLSMVTNINNMDETYLYYRCHSNQQTIRHSFKQAHLSALALVAYNLRLKNYPDPFSNLTDLKNWQIMLQNRCPISLENIRFFMAGTLADNGGSLCEKGSAFLHKACCRAVKNGSKEACARLSLACVRHQLKLFRNKQWKEAFAFLFFAFKLWDYQLLTALFHHISIIWKCKKKLFLFRMAPDITHRKQ